MVNISDWGDFRLGDLLSEIYKAEAHVKTDLSECAHSDAKAIPFISRTENDNGCDCFVVNDGDISGIEEGNAVIIGDTTSTIFYQPDSFVAGDHIVVCRADWINRRTALFVKSVLEKDRYRYNYGRAFKMDLIKETRIKLPQTSSGDPDWQAMSDFMAELEAKDNQGKGKLADALQTENAEAAKPVSSDDWGEFRVEDLFTPSTGDTDILQDMLEDSGEPVVSAGEENEGVIGRTTVPARVFPPNTITLDMFGQVFAHGYEYKMVTHARVLSLAIKGHKATLGECLFLASIINRNKYKFAYGRMCNWERIKDELILLPQAASGTPDWAAMERMIKGLPYGDRI